MLSDTKESAFFLAVDTKVYIISSHFNYSSSKISRTDPEKLYELFDCVSVPHTHTQCARTDVNLMRYLKINRTLYTVCLLRKMYYRIQ